VARAFRLRLCGFQLCRECGVGCNAVLGLVGGCGGNPARRCVATRRTGVRCRNWVIRGGTVCRYHGGSTAHVKRKAKERLDRDQDLATMRAIVRRTLGDLAIPAGKARNAFAARPEASPPPAQRVCEVNIDAGQDKPTPEPPQDNVIEEHRARHGLPADEPPALVEPALEVVDAELVDPESATPREPPFRGPSQAVAGRARPDSRDVAADKTASATRHLAPPPVSVTYEGAVTARIFGCYSEPRPGATRALGKDS
jgi:hypothetical protein